MCEKRRKLHGEVAISHPLAPVAVNNSQRCFALTYLDFQSPVSGMKTESVQQHRDTLFTDFIPPPHFFSFLN